MRLPGLLQEIAEVAGEDAALKVAAAVGGTRQYIPGSLGDEHWLIDALGRAKAEAVCQHFSHVDEEGRPSGQHWQIPLGPVANDKVRRRRMAQALAKGASARDAAQSVGAHERTAWRVKARMGAAETDQDDLFGRQG